MKPNGTTVPPLLWQAAEYASNACAASRISLLPTECQGADIVYADPPIVDPAEAYAAARRDALPKFGTPLSSAGWLDLLEGKPHPRPDVQTKRFFRALRQGFTASTRIIGDGLADLFLCLSIYHASRGRRIEGAADAVRSTVFLLSNHRSDAPLSEQVVSRAWLTIASALTLWETTEPQRHRQTRAQFEGLRRMLADIHDPSSFT